MSDEMHPAAKAWEAENLGLSSAAICRKYDWNVGDIIIGQERGSAWWQDTALRIVWIGREAVMFESVASRCHTYPRWSSGYDHESAAWTLDLRPWRRASEVEIEAIGTEIKRSWGEPARAGESEDA